MIIKLAWEKKWKHLNKLSLLRRLSLVKGYDCVIVKICSFIVSGNHLEIVPSFSRYVAWFFAHFYPSHQHRNLCEQAHIWIARERRRAKRSDGKESGEEVHFLFSRLRARLCSNVCLLACKCPRFVIAVDHRGKFMKHQIWYCTYNLGQFVALELFGNRSNLIEPSRSTGFLYMLCSPSYFDWHCTVYLLLHVHTKAVFIYELQNSWTNTVWIALEDFEGFWISRANLVNSV